MYFPGFGPVNKKCFSNPIQVLTFEILTTMLFNLRILLSECYQLIFLFHINMISRNDSLSEGLGLL